MSESLPHQPSIEEQQKQELKQKLKINLISLAKELSQRTEGFPFPGITEETLEILRAVDEEYPGYTTPTDKIIEKMKNEGIKIVLGNDPESGNVFALPQSSDDVEMDSLFPRYLVKTRDMDPSLGSLIDTQQAFFESMQKKD